MKATAPETARAEALMSPPTRRSSEDERTPMNCEVACSNLPASWLVNASAPWMRLRAPANSPRTSRRLFAPISAGAALADARDSV